MTERNHNHDDDNEGKNSLINFKNIGIDGFKFLAAISFVVWITWLVITERYNIKDDFETKISQNTENIRRLDALDHDVILKEHEKQKQEIQVMHEQMKMVHEQIQGTIEQQGEVIDRIKDLLTKLRERQLYVLENIWTREDHNNWCREVQLKNSNWICPLYESVDRKRFLLNREQSGINNSLAEDLKRALEEDPNQLWQTPETKHPANKK